MKDFNLTLFLVVVTQIPLEPAGRGALDQDQNRPPWIRPVRKKSSAPRSNDSVSQHSSPEGFSPSEFFIDMNTPQTGSKPDFGQSSNSVHSSTASNQGALNSSTTPPPFMDTSSGMSMDDATMYMSPAEVLALFNDGGVDMASLFPPTSEYLHSTPSQDGIGSRSYDPSSPFGKTINGPRDEETTSMMGLVSSP